MRENIGLLRLNDTHWLGLAGGLWQIVKSIWIIGFAMGLYCHNTKSQQERGRYGVSAL